MEGLLLGAREESERLVSRVREETERLRMQCEDVASLHFRSALKWSEERELLVEAKARSDKKLKLLMRAYKTSKLKDKEGSTWEKENLLPADLRMRPAPKTADRMDAVRAPKTAERIDVVRAPKTADARRMDVLRPPEREAQTEPKRRLLETEAKRRLLEDIDDESAPRRRQRRDESPEIIKPLREAPELKGRLPPNPIVVDAERKSPLRRKKASPVKAAFRRPTVTDEQTMPPGRSRAERARVPGHQCPQCEAFVKAMCPNLSAKEAEYLKNTCSRHRAFLKPPTTPDGFWDLSFADSHDGK